MRPAAVLVGVVLALLLVEGGLRLAGMVYRGLLGEANQRALAGVEAGFEGSASRNLDRPGVRVLCLGESTTVLGGRDSYPGILQELLDERTRGRFAVVNGGIPGTNTGYIVSHLPAWLDRYRPGVVVTMMGVNDRDGGNFLARPGAEPAWSPASLRAVKLLRTLLGGLSRRIRGESNVFDPNDPRAHMEFWTHDFREPCRTPGMKERLERAVADDPDDVWALIALARCQRKNPRRSAELSARALALEPENGWAHAEMAKAHFIEGRLDRAEAHLKRAVAALPHSHLGYAMLKELYQLQGRLQDALAFFEGAVRKNPADDQARRRLALLYRELGRNADARQQLEAADSLPSATYGGLTGENYRLALSLLRERGIPLVAVQYPMRDAAPLRRLLSDRPGPGDGLQVVENRDPFREILHHRRVDELFVDLFAGDFGHCTREGNTIIARSVLPAVLRAVEHDKARSPAAP